jgi:hypothetical protein
VRKRAPLTGEHTARVLEEFGIGHAAIASPGDDHAAG